MIRAMAALQDRHLLALATDIVHYGLDPSDLFIVMEKRDKCYVVLDGNRRVTALKVLKEPEIVRGAVSNSVLSTLEQLSKEYDSDSTATALCVIVDERTEANHWIELRHTGYQKGVGPSRWGSDEGARFRELIGGKLDAETQALNFLQKRGAVNRAFRRRVPTTTFRRLLRTPEVREKLGLDWKDGKLMVVGDEDASARALLHVAKELAEGRITVRQVDRKQHRIDYAESLPPDIVVPRSTTQPSKPADITTERKASTTTAKPRPRDQLIPSNVELNITDARIQNIATELDRLSLRQYPNAVSVLFRVFLELSADAYIDGARLPNVTVQQTLARKLLAVTNDLVVKTKLSDQEAKVVRRAAQRDSYLGPSITGMHQYIHNRHLFPGPADLRADWHSLEPWFRAVWEL